MGQPFTKRKDYFLFLENNLNRPAFCKENDQVKQVVVANDLDHLDGPALAKRIVWSILLF